MEALPERAPLNPAIGGEQPYSAAHATWATSASTTTTPLPIERLLDAARHCFPVRASYVSAPIGRVRPRFVAIFTLDS